MNQNFDMKGLSGMRWSAEQSQQLPPQTITNHNAVNMSLDVSMGSGLMQGTDKAQKRLSGAIKVGGKQSGQLRAKKVSKTSAKQQPL